MPGIHLKGIVTGIIAITALSDDLQQILRNRKARGTISENRCAYGILQTFSALRKIDLQIPEGASSAKPMEIAVGSDFMSALVNLSYESGKARRDPSKDEKGYTNPARVFAAPLARSEGIEQIKQSMRVFDHAEFTMIPCIIRDPWLEILHLKPVFHIDCQKNSRTR